MARSYTANALETTLVNPMTPGSTEIEVASATGLPTVPFYVVIDPYNNSAREFILVGAKAGTTLSSLTRNLTGSKSQTHSASDLLRTTLVAQTLDDLWDEIAAHTHAHSATTGITTDDHHNEAHTVASHSDTTATGAELDNLTDGSNADALHSHAAGSVASVFGRSGAVVAALSDYDDAQVDNTSTVTGATVKDALDTLDGAIGGSDLYFVPNTGGDMRAAIQAAINDADTDGGGHVILDRGINTIATSTLTDARADKVGLLVPEKVFLVGQGPGNGRSGTTVHAATQITNTATPSLSGGQKYHVVSRGGGVALLHINDDADHADSLLNVTGLNGYLINQCSFSENTKAASYCIRIQNSNNDQPTQYGRIFNCNLWAYENGIGNIGNVSGGGNPDWEVVGTQIQHEGGSTPVAGSTGIYMNTNAMRVFGGEIQFFDIGVHIFGNEGRGKHITLDKIHFEAHQGASDNTYEAAVKITRSGSLHPAFTLIEGCEIANTGKFIDGINIDTNVEGTRINNFRVRDQRWLVFNDSILVNNGTDTYVDGVAA
jgi:hypothetical protein